MLGPKEVRIHSPNAQARDGPYQGANCKNTILMHLRLCEVCEEGKV